MLTAPFQNILQSEPVDGLISDAIRKSVLVFSVGLTLLLLIPFMILRGKWDGIYDPNFYVLLLEVLVLLTAPIVFWLSKSLQVTGVYVNVLSFFMFVVYVFIDGGLLSSAIVWAPILPLFAVLYSGRRYGILVFLFIALFLAMLFFAHQLDWVSPSDLDQSQLERLYFISASEVTAMLLLLAILYVSWQDSIQKQIAMAQKIKDDFLSGVSHELRTPLNSILGFSEVLTRGYVGELNEKQEEYIGYITMCGNHLLVLVNSLLDISKIDSGKFSFEPVVTNVNALLTPVVKMMRDKFDGNQIRLDISIDQDIQDKSISIDADKIMQVLLHLLDNAIKFSPAGRTVHLHIGVNDRNLLIEVTDEGIGIPVHLQEKVFDRFFQIHNSSKSKDSGAGLGLAISKHFIEMHGGEIYVKNAANGAGSSFVCNVPCNPVVSIDDEIE